MFGNFSQRGWGAMDVKAKFPNYNLEIFCRRGDLKNKDNFPNSKADICEKYESYKMLTTSSFSIWSSLRMFLTQTFHHFQPPHSYGSIYILFQFLKKHQSGQIVKLLMNFMIHPIIDVHMFCDTFKLITDSLPSPCGSKMIMVY